MIRKFHESELLGDGGLLVASESVQEERIEEDGDWLCTLFDWLTWPLTTAMSAAFAGAGWLLHKWGLRKRFKEWATEFVD